MKILVTGANGQLGKEIQTIVNNRQNKQEHSFFFTDIEDLDITDYEDLRKYISQHKITCIINCAAYTNVDKAEDEPEKAYLINEHAVDNIASIAREQNIGFIHVSTDYVFNGKNFLPYKETDTVNPESIYGKSKLAGEKKVLDKNAGIIIRTSWLYSSYGKNFVNTIKRLANERDELNVVFDQVGSPTFAGDLARGIIDIVDYPFSVTHYGIYHFSNEGVCSWYDLAKEITSSQKINCLIHPIESKEFPTKATRPHYSVLNNSKIKKTFGLVIPHWKESLHKMLKTSK